MNVLDFPERKRRHQRIVMVTCYDATSASILAETSVDMLLVGDSAAMVMHGHDTTLPIGVADMATHVRAVRAGAPDAFVVADLPFMATRKGLERAMMAIEALMKAGANAVKIEGIGGHEALIRHVVESGVPVMGHLGLTPQSVHQLGGFRVQGRDDEARERLLADAKKCALRLVEGYQPPEPAELFLPGPSGKASLAFALRDLYAKGVATEHDMVVATELAEVLTGGAKADFTEPMSEDAILKMERAAFMRLVKTPATLARVEHTLETGKPLRN